MSYILCGVPQVLGGLLSLFDLLTYFLKCLTYCLNLSLSSRQPFAGVTFCGNTRTHPKMGLQSGFAPRLNWENTG